MADPMVLIGRINPADLQSFVESVAQSWRDLTEWKWTGRVAPGGSSVQPGFQPDWKWVKCSSMPRRLPNMYTVWYGAVFDVDAEMRQPSRRLQPLAAPPATTCSAARNRMQDSLQPHLAAPPATVRSAACTACTACSPACNRLQCCTCNRMQAGRV